LELRNLYADLTKIKDGGMAGVDTTRPIEAGPTRGREEHLMLRPVLIFAVATASLIFAGATYGRSGGGMSGPGATGPSMPMSTSTDKDKRKTEQKESEKGKTKGETEQERERKETQTETQERTKEQEKR
jgi:hypothetical protein